MELLTPSSRWDPFISVDPERLGGEPVFRGTRFPVRVLFECLKEGQSITEFLDEFEGVPHEFATAVLDLLGGNLSDELQLGAPNESGAA